MNKTRVLIVDDDFCVTRVLARVFETAGCRVTTAPDGQRALASLAAERFDVMISDIQMPRMSGEDLCTHLWKTGPYLPRCIIIVTSRSQENERGWTQQIPGITLMEKPVGPKQILRTVRERLAAERDASASTPGEAAA